MNVQELMDKLSTMNPELPVWHDGGGDPYLAGEFDSVHEFTFPTNKRLMGHDSTPETVVMLGYGFG